MNLRPRFPFSSTRIITSWRKCQVPGSRAGCGALLCARAVRCADPRSWMLRFPHPNRGIDALPLQQPENNVVRVAIQALAAVMGGTQSLHTNSMDEALWLPTEKSVRVALRTHRYIGYESGVEDTIDPWAGSYMVEYLTDEIESRAMEYIRKIDEMGAPWQQSKPDICKMRSRKLPMLTNGRLKRRSRSWLE